MFVPRKLVFLALGLLVAAAVASPAPACVQDVAIGADGSADMAHDTDGDHPPIAVCAAGVACGRCGECSDCGFCIVNPQGAPCEKASDCPQQGGTYMPFSTCFADPAWNPDAMATETQVGDSATGITQRDASDAATPPMSPATNACNASARASHGAVGLLLLALICLLARRRYFFFF